MKEKVCVIIVTYNIAKGIYKCFNSIEKQVSEVIIIDNGSNHETIKELIKLEKKDNVKIIFNEDNYGIGYAINQGIKYAIEKEYSWVLTLDHDSEASADMLEKMVEAYYSIENRESVGILCPRVFDINKNGYLIDENIDKAYRELKVAIQSGSLIKTDILNKIGFFNELLFMYYVDVEFSLRLRNKNLKIIQIKNAVLFHEEGNKITKKLFNKKYIYNNYNELAIYYIARNSIYMIRNFKYNKKSYIRRLKDDLEHILLFDGNRMKKLRYYFKGIYDGINNVYGRYKKTQR